MKKLRQGITVIKLWGLISLEKKRWRNENIIQKNMLCTNWVWYFVSLASRFSMNNEMIKKIMGIAPSHHKLEEDR